jgi:hypothetical protein
VTGAYSHAQGSQRGALLLDVSSVYSIVQGVSAHQ